MVLAGTSGYLSWAGDGPEEKSKTPAGCLRYELRCAIRVRGVVGLAAEFLCLVDLECPALKRNVNG